MAEIEPGDDAPFRELHGDYVENAGQTINLREYLDYFEPLGSALSRLPDGAGGPFVQHFTDSGGRTIGSVGWVVSAASKRFGGWKLWGMWSNRQIPAVALPLFWPTLADPNRVSDWVGRANEDSDLLLNRDRWPELLDEVKTTRLHDAAFRESLKTELARMYAVPPPHRHPFEVELTPKMLEVLPWLYLLGPVDPSAAQLQPSRFHGAGYQYILAEHGDRRGADVKVPAEVDAMVDLAADDVLGGWRMANELRARRGRPSAAESRKATRSKETNAMRKATSTQTQTPKSSPPAPALWDQATLIGTLLYRVAVVGLLAWIALNVYLIRKGAVTPPDAAPAVSSSPVEPRVPERSTTVAPESTRERVRRIAASISARPLPGTPISDVALAEIATGGAGAADKLARIAVEVFIRRNGCFERSTLSDGKFSAAEQRAIRGCAVLQDERLVTSTGDPDDARAIQWLDRAVAGE